MEDIVRSQPPKKGKNIVKSLSILFITALSLFIGKHIWYYMQHEQTDNAQVERKLVPVISRVSGFIVNICITDFSQVKEGQLLVETDSTDLLVQLQEMIADLDQSLADVAETKASLVNADASLSAERENLSVIDLRKQKSKEDFDRDYALFEDHAITEKQFDQSRNDYNIHEKQLDAGKKNVQVAESRLGVLKAQLKKAKPLYVKRNFVSKNSGLNCLIVK